MKKRVLVVGSGGAGLTAAISARKAGAEVVLLSKTRCAEAGCTAYSGGLFSLSSGTVSPEDHYRRIMETGRYVNNPSLVRTLADHSEATLRTLSEWGVSLKITISGHATARKTAPSRIMGGGGMTRELASIAKHEEVSILENHIASRLLIGEHGVEGVEAVDWKKRKTFTFGASSVILATGGGGAIYERTDNPLRMTGDGYALALEAGLELIDMEYVQFYPMGWEQRGYPVWMVGLGLLDYIPVTDENGKEFLKEAFPLWGVATGKEANLFARDRAALLLAGHAAKGGKTLLHLEKLREEDLSLPDVQASLLFDLPPEKRSAPVRVSPVQHYFTGGVPMDSEGRTSLPGLFVCGEVSGGVDGASRMGGNALTNILVFGLRAGKASAEEPPTPSRVADAEIRMPERLLQSDREGVTPAEVRRELRGIVQEGLAPWRNEEGIERCLSKIEMLNVPRRALRIASSLDLLHAIELHGLHRTAEAVGRAALARKESRGVHFREDYPNERDEWKRRIRVLLEGGTVTAGIGN